MIDLAVVVVLVLATVVLLPAVLYLIFRITK